MGMPQPVGYLYWYTTSIILGILTLLNIITIALRYATRRARSAGIKTTTTNLDSACSSPTTSSSSSLSKDVEDTRIVRKLGTGERLGRACTLATDKYVGLSALPIPKLRWWIKRAPPSSVATTEVAWSVVYTLGCLILSFYGTNMKDAKSYANQAAWISAAQMPLIIALAGKNNLVSFLTGISYEKLNFLHRAAGRVCFLGIWIHAGGWFYTLGGFHSENWNTQLSRWGFTGLLAFTLLTVTSVRWVRHRIYEFFLITHVCLAALTLAAFIMHWRAVDKWIYPGIGLWAADRLFRILRLFILNKLWTVIPSPTAANLPSTATLTLLTPSTLKVSFQTPSAQLNWSAGQHFYVVMPGMARLPWEAHPFTAATVPLRNPHGEDKETGELTFIVRVRDGFTKRMKNRVDKERRSLGLAVDEECKIEVKAAVEGPYGQVRKVDLYDGVLIVAGGSGISFAVAHLLQVVQDAKAGKPHPRRFSIIWMIKSRLHLNWIAPILLAHATNIPTSLHVSLHIHVTRQYIPRASLSLPPTAALPADPGQSDDSWQTYLARRAAGPPRRKSRLMSTMSWATWTGAFDTDSEGQSGLATRRGSTAVFPLTADRSVIALPAGTAGSGPTGSGIPQLEAEPRFLWSEGYNEGETPTSSATDYARRISSAHRRASEAPSISALPEDDDGEEKEKTSINSSDTPPRPYERSSFARTSLSQSRPSSAPESPRRTSLALPPSSLGPGSAGRKSSAGILLDAPPRRNLSISIEEPALMARRRSSVQSSATPPSPSGSSRRGSLLPHLGTAPPSPSGSSRRGSNLPTLGHTLPRHKSSGLLNVTIPAEVHEDPSPPLEELDEKDPFYLPPPPLITDHNNPYPATRPASALLVAPMMIKTSSQHSGISVRSASASSPSTPTSFLPILRNHETSSSSGSGIATPTLSVAKPPDLTLPADESNPSTLLEQTFAASSQERAKQSIGLEKIVHWHEGRADLRRTIEEMMHSVGKGGIVDVEACGPRSLLDKTKDVVKELSDVKAVWNGETKVIYHAETFGW